MATQQNTSEMINIGVSACLLGHAVRYNGGHCRNRFLLSVLDRFFNWVPVCPEVEFGLSVPRPTLRLKRHNGRIHLIMPEKNRDLTTTMQAFCEKRVDALADRSLCGYILKKNSPSCGLSRVKVYDEREQFCRDGQGLFAQSLSARFSNLPIEEEGRLSDPVLRDNWITRVFAYHRLQALWENNGSIGDLQRFHAAHKYLLLAHSPQLYSELGRLVAQAKSLDRNKLQAEYERHFMTALSQIATVGKNTNVLFHMAGFFKNKLDSDDRRELHNYILEYRAGHIPLSVPLTLITHYARSLDTQQLLAQVYLNPHPKELALRNHVEMPDNPIVQHHANTTKEHSPGKQQPHEAQFFNQHFPR